MPAVIDDFFLDDRVEEYDYYPGSKRKLGTKTTTDQIRIPVEEWGKPVRKMFRGKPIDLWTISALGVALGKSIVTLRLWERQGYLPKAPFRIRVNATDGPESAGRRYYSQELIEAAVDEFSKRNLLHAPRIEWRDHTDLADVLAARWKEILQDL